MHKEEYFILDTGKGLWIIKTKINFIEVMQKARFIL